SRNENESGLTSNQIRGGTAQAIGVVERLYEIGAPFVHVPEDGIRADADTVSHEGGPYADAVVVSPPEDRLARRRVLAICRREVERDGEFDAAEACERRQVFLWRDLGGPPDPPV